MVARAWLYESRLDEVVVGREVNRHVNLPFASQLHLQRGAMARVELGALSALRNIAYQHQHLWRADEIDIAGERQLFTCHADGSPKVIVQIDGGGVSVLGEKPPSCSPEGESLDGTFVCEELCLGAEGVREIMIAGIVLEFHV